MTEQERQIPPPGRIPMDRQIKKMRELTDSVAERNERIHGDPVTEQEERGTAQEALDRIWELIPHGSESERGLYEEVAELRERALTAESRVQELEGERREQDRLIADLGSFKTPEEADEVARAFRRTHMPFSEEAE